MRRRSVLLGAAATAIASPALAMSSAVRQVLLGGGALARQRATLARLKIAANAAVNNNPEYLGTYSPAATITFTNSADAALTNVLTYTTNQDKIATTGGRPVQNGGANGFYTSDDWAVEQSNSSADAGTLATTGFAGGWPDFGFNLWSPAVEFIHTGQKFELLLRQLSGESASSKIPVRTIVNGQYLDKTGTGNFTNLGYYHVDFGSSATRTIRVEHRHIFRALRVAPGDTVTKPAPGIKVILEGDSYTEGQSIRYGGAQLVNGHVSWGPITCRQLGWTDPNQVAVGLTGYVNNGTTRRTIPVRINDWAGRNPEVIMDMAGFNDGTNYATTYAAAIAYWRALRAAYPAAFIAVLGVPGGSAPSVKQPIESNLQAAYTAWGDRFSCFVPISNAAGGSLVYELDSDNVHPSGGDTGTGHTTIGNFIYAQVLAALNALVL